MRIGLISLAAPPATGGAAIYIELLARNLDSVASVDELHIFCERIVGDTPDPLREFVSTTAHRQFAVRATRTQRSFRDYVAFGVQQLNYLQVARSVARLKLDGLLIHTDVLRRPTLVNIVVRAARSVGTHVSLDSRDISLTASRRRALDQFDSIIACGLGPKEHIESLLGDQARTAPVLIPIPYTPSPPVPEADSASAQALLKTLGVAPSTPFVMMTGGLTPAKGPVEAAETALELARSGTPLPIVSCGPNRVEHPTIDRARESGAFVYAGRVPHETHLALLDSAACIASFSVKEGLPRTILEAIAQRKRLFAPSCVPEFASLPQLSGDAAHRASQIRQSMSVPAPDYNYDLDIHNPQRVLEALSDHFRRQQS